MRTYNLPRSGKGEGRILFIFTGKSLIYTVVGGGIGLIFYFLFSSSHHTDSGIYRSLPGTVKKGLHKGTAQPGRKAADGYR